MPSNKKLLNRLEGLFSPAKSAAPPGDAPAAHLAAPPSHTSEDGPAGAPTGWAWEADSQGVYTFCSPEVEAVLGFMPAEMVGQALLNFIADAEAAHQLTEILNAARAFIDFCAPARRKDGQIVSLVLNGRPVRQDDGRLAGYHGLSHVASPASEGEALTHPESQPQMAPEAPPAAGHEAWRALALRQRTADGASADEFWGYLDSSNGVEPIGDFTTPELTEALSRGQRVFRLLKGISDEALPEDAGRALAIPIRLQNQTIGALNFFDESGEHPWSEDDLALVQAVADQLALALENTRLFNETRDYLLKQTLLYEVTHAAASATNLNQALQSAAEALGRVLPDSDIAIMLLDESEVTLRIRAAVGFPQDLANKLTLRVGEGVTGWVAQTNQPALVPDVRQDARYVTGAPEMRSEVAVPLAQGQRVIGVLNVESPSVNAFTESDVQLLSTLAGTLSAIIVNNNLLEQIGREREPLALLYDVLRALTISLDVETRINTALQLARRLGAQHAYILLLGETPEGDLFRSTIPGLDQLSSTEALEMAHQITTHGLERSVIESRRPVVVNDTLFDARWYTAPSHVELEPARSVISLPLQTQRGSLTGVLAYTHTQPGMFTSEQVPLIESIASQVAVAVENAQLFQQVNRQERNASILARATQAMSRTLNEEDVLRVLADELFQAYLPEAVLLLRWEPGPGALTPLVIRLDIETDSRAFPVEGESFSASARPDLLEEIRNGNGHIRSLDPANPLQESMALPLLYGGEVEGVVEIVQTGRQRGLSREDLDLFRSMLASASAALQSARLFALQRETAERLAEVDRLKSQFLANMSHELRTPLNSIIGFSRVMLKGIDGPLNEVQTQDLTSINNAGQHLLTLINSVLDMAKIEAGKMELVFDEVLLPELFDTVLTTTSALIKDKPVALRREVAPDLPAVRADSVRVRQVLLNLLANAAKFTETGHITLSARTVETDSPRTQQVEPFVEISVMDTGPGIAPTDMPKLFEAFSQVDASPTRKTGGTGLGLSICRHLVELHGGRIWAESEPGQGSAFSFILPVNKSELSESPESPEESYSRAMPGSSPVILVVDDDQGVINLYRRYLEPHGYRLAGVVKSAEAVTRAAELKPTAILLDILMPNPDGWQVLAELKRSEATAPIPVIICSLVADRERGMSMGAADYLVKPILETDLLRALNKLPALAGNRPAGEAHVVNSPI